MNQNDNISAIIHAGTELGKLQNQQRETKSINGIDSLVKPDGSITPLVLPERYLDAPRRKRGKVNLYEGRSFIQYVNAHKVAGRTHLFGKATELGGSFTAIFDYHHEENPAVKQATEDAQATAPTAKPDANAMAAWGEHRAVLSLETTPEWGRWVKNNGLLLAQESFAEFIQDNLNDIIRPDSALILDMAQGLIGRKSVEFQSGKNLKDGSIKFQYIEEIIVNNTTNRRDNAFEVPDSFTLGLCPFVGANGIEVEARVRFRIGGDGKLSFAYILNRPYKVIEAAFIHTRDDLEREIGLPVLLGSAEIAASGQS